MAVLAIFFCALVQPHGVLAQGGRSKTAGAQGTYTDVDDIRRLIAKYGRSIDTADTKLASEVWSNRADVTFIHPRGHERGLEQVMQNFYGRTMGEVFSERKLTINEVSVHVEGTAAWAEFYWEFDAKLKKDGSPLKTKGRETQVYRKEGPSGWCLVHVHYSGMPVTGERQGF
jgi:ketosteroid isomerase-like protein